MTLRRLIGLAMDCVDLTDTIIIRNNDESFPYAILCFKDYSEYSGPCITFQIFNSKNEIDLELGDIFDDGYNDDLRERGIDLYSEDWNIPEYELNGVARKIWRIESMLDELEGERNDAQ